MVSLSQLRLQAARARIADVWLSTTVSERLGGISLHPHQRLAAARATRAIERHGGCLLADDVGRGKTYVALAVARAWHRPLVVVPAALRHTWERAMDRAQVACAMVTHEALSRGINAPCDPDGIIVDESHRFRSTDARRYEALARIAARAPLLLLSATPLQNGTRDLAAQLALFLGARAFRSSDDTLARFVVRSAEREHTGELPVVAPPRWLRPMGDDGRVLRAILALPPPTRPFDAGDAGALRTIGLVRAWASSRAALIAALRRRSRTITALEQCAASGLAASTRDLRAWQGVDGDVQLALAPMLISRGEADGGRALLAAVETERAAVERLVEVIRECSDPDDARIAALRMLRAEYPGARILAFSEFATTIRAYYAMLGTDAGVGMLTASEARIASGALSRQALLERFAPVAQGAPHPPARERVTLLLATDLLSEGVNLQDASILVHLDLPWNPARLAQRLGRVRRPGGAAIVRSYLMSPPATTEVLLRVDARLRAKLARAERTIGRTLQVMPSLCMSANALAGALSCPSATGTTGAESLGAVTDRIAAWHCRCQRRVSCDGRMVVAAARCAVSGWLAALDDGRLLARVGDAPVCTDGAVESAVALACGAPRMLRADERGRAFAEVTNWLDHEALALDCGVRGESDPLDIAIERRVAAACARAPRHVRASVVALAAVLRTALGRPRPLGAERELEGLLQAHAARALDDVEWLERSIHVAELAPDRVQRTRPQVVALIVLGGDSGERARAGVGDVGCAPSAGWPPQDSALRPHGPASAVGGERDAVHGNGVHEGPRGAPVG